MILNCHKVKRVEVSIATALPHAVLLLGYINTNLGIQCAAIDLKIYPFPNLSHWNIALKKFRLLEICHITCSREITS